MTYLRYSITAAFIFLSVGCHKTVYTTINSEPPDASLEVATPGSGWNPVGQTPKVVKFTAPFLNSERQQALIRVMKPGYYNEEKSFKFEALPTELKVKLKKVE